MSTSVTAFLGDTERRFHLTDPMIRELERVSGVGIGALYQRAVGMTFQLKDVSETIRLGLIGGGTEPKEAAQIVETYVHNRPMSETYPLALDVLDARWIGAPKEEAPQ